MPHILLIDDDTEFRTMLKLVLEKAGFDVSEASNGKEGIRLYKSTHFDLVVSDVFMPEKEGIETTIELKTINPDIKIIAISGGGKNNELNFLDSLKHFGAQCTFQKPFNTKEFVKAINELIEAD